MDESWIESLPKEVRDVVDEFVDEVRAQKMVLQSRLTRELIEMAEKDGTYTSKQSYNLILLAATLAATARNTTRGLVKSLFTALTPTQEERTDEERVDSGIDLFKKEVDVARDKFRRRMHSMMEAYASTQKLSLSQCLSFLGMVEPIDDAVGDIVMKSMGSLVETLTIVAASQKKDNTH